MGLAMGKDPVNSLSVEGLIQKTLVTSPEVAYIFILYENVCTLWHFPIWVICMSYDALSPKCLCVFENTPKYACLPIFQDVSVSFSVIYLIV